MSLYDHARAAQITADAFMASGQRDMAAGLLDSATVSLAMAGGYADAAVRMFEVVLAESLEHGCTIDHSALKAPKCPACGAPRG